jgi:hypothetical protein
MQFSTQKKKYVIYFEIRLTADLQGESSIIGSNIKFRGGGNKINTSVTTVFFHGFHIFRDKHILIIYCIKIPISNHNLKNSL